ncbi:MAG: uracil phosphoribosyltransferase [Sulfolobales archaeon]|nr:uracil phosphoribosyltransferase [Sulfolobales archaeon]MCX8208644.1 uracil phosphoribosyltransferase [Sulfolobales archaeon]MDW8010527.1 uracil phosphoribosyltransferase [Sulfolobales archaeon]
MLRVRVVDHPYAQAILTVLRDRRISQIEFRKGLVRLGRVIGFEMVKELDVEECEVETPLGVKTKGVRVKDLDRVVIITVLRAAWPLTEGLVKIFFNARQGVVVARRVEEKGMRNYEFDVDIAYLKIPSIGSENIVILSDVMVATGSTADRALREVVKYGKAKKYFLTSVITTPIALARLSKVSEELGIDLTVYSVAIDPEVNERGYIVPGLGDAGDRAFGS